MFRVLEGSIRLFPSVPCPLSCLAPQVAFSTLIISTLCRRSRRAARINLIFIKENYIFLYSMIYDMCADRCRCLLRTSNLDIKLRF